MDYAGNPAIVVTYAWTNNSDTTVSPAATITARAFQNGEELEAAMILDEEVFSAENAVSDARPGTSVDVPCAFVLPDQTAVLTFELSESDGGDGSVVSMDIDPASLE